MILMVLNFSSLTYESCKQISKFRLYKPYSSFCFRINYEHLYLRYAGSKTHGNKHKSFYILVSEHKVRLHTLNI